MSHGFESGFFGGNQAAWHGLGTVIPEQVVSSEAAIKLAKLDWSVQKEQLQHKGTDIEGKFVTFREVLKPLSGTAGNPVAPMSPKIHPLGVVGNQYTPLQNVDAFKIGDDIVKAASGAAHWHTAGSLAEGRRVWMLLDLGQYNVGAEGEDIDQFLLISNSHDGSSALQVMTTDVRVVCQNTLSLATATAQRKFSVRHTTNMEQRVEEAKHILGLASARREDIIAEAQSLLAQSFGVPDFKRMIEVIVPIPEEASDRSVTMAQNKRDQLYTGFKLSDNIDNIRGTKWGALQSVIEVNDHVLTSRTNAERRFMQITDGTDLVAKANDYLLSV